MPRGRPTKVPHSFVTLWVQVKANVATELDALASELAAQTGIAGVSRQDAARTVLDAWLSKRAEERSGSRGKRRATAA